MSAVALLIRQAWQNGLVPGSVATLLDEGRILTEKRAGVRRRLGGKHSILALKSKTAGCFGEFKKGIAFRVNHLQDFDADANYLPFCALRLYRH